MFTNFSVVFLLELYKLGTASAQYYSRSRAAYIIEVINIESRENH